MLIEKMENLKETIRVVTETIERTHAQYITYFPQLAKEIADLRLAIINRHNERLESDEEELERLQAASVEGELSSSKELSVVDQDMEQEDQPEDTKRSRREEKDYRILVKRCLALTHPDKCMRFSSELKRKLRDAFHEAKRLASKYAPEELQALYVRICFLRNELFRIPDQLLKAVEHEIRMLEMDLNHLTRHPVFGVVVEHQNHRPVSAKNLFQLYLLSELEALRSELNSRPGNE